MMAYVFGLITYLGWGSGDLFGTFATRRIGPYLTTFWAFAFAAILGAFYVPFALGNLHTVTPLLFAQTVLLGAIYIIGNVTFNEALRLSSAPIVGTVGGSFAALTVLLSYLFLGETISPLSIALIVMVFAGVFITTTAHNQKRDAGYARGMILALVSFLFWGIYFTFNKVLMARMGWFWPNYIPILLFPFIGAYMKLRHMKVALPQKGTAIPLVLNAVALRGGDFAFNIGASLGLTATIAPFGGAYPTLFAILSYLVFRDPLNRKQIVGILIALCGIVALGFVGR